MDEEPSRLSAQQTGNHNTQVNVGEMHGDIHINRSSRIADLESSIKHLKSKQQQHRGELKVLNSTHELYSQPRQDDIFRQKYLPLLLILVLAALASSFHILLSVIVAGLGLFYYATQWLPRQSQSNQPLLADMEEKKSRLEKQIADDTATLQNYEAEMKELIKETKSQ